MIDIENRLKKHVAEKGDISDHLMYLKEISTECESILECGVRSVVSSWAFLNGLVKNDKDKKILHSCDLDRSNNINDLEKACQEQNVSFTFHQCSDLDLPSQTYDMIFIDTWHVYGHLKRELARWNMYVNKYIILHDTTVDEWYGETIRMYMNAEQQSKDTGIPVLEIKMGLWPAVVEFLSQHPEWVLEKRFTNNNGLTVLRRL